MVHKLSKNNLNCRKVKTNKQQLSKLSYQELEAIFSMACKICEGNYHKDYIDYYKVVVELIRVELDERIQGQIFLNQ